MTTVVVTGAASALGQRVVALLVADPDVHQVVALDVQAVTFASPQVQTHRIDLSVGNVAPLLDGADAVVHLASAFGPIVDGPELADAAEVTLARRVLEASTEASVPTVVLMSSALVYGAWANNAVPLTEDAPMRPHSALRFAVEKAEIERLAGEWRRRHADVRSRGDAGDDGSNDDARPCTVAVLRPVPWVGDGSRGWMAQGLDAVARLATGDGDPPTQWLHLDDLASAVDVARRAAIDGPVNVAPDGWLDASERRALTAPLPRIRVPERVAVKAANWRWRLGSAPTPPGILAYAQHSWVVANDRLRAAGWEPSFTNDEAFVAAHEPGPLASLSPRRRQELALGAAAGVAVSLIAGVVLAVRRRNRRGHSERAFTVRPLDASRSWLRTRLLRWVPRATAAPAGAALHLLPRVTRTWRSDDPRRKVTSIRSPGAWARKALTRSPTDSTGR